MTGDLAIEARFSEADTFSNGLARVYEQGMDGCGFIDHTGEYAISSRYSRAMDFSEGLAAAKLGTKWGFIDRSGEYVLEPRYAYAEPFRAGLARIETEDGKMAYIEPSGRIIWEEP